MPVDVIMPRIDMVMEEGTVVRWYRAEHEMVTAGEPLLEIETDKATFDVEAPASGVLAAISAKPGDRVPVAQRIAVILAPGETATDRLNYRSPVPAGNGATADEALPRPRATPAARALARQYSLNLATIPGSGPRGRIHKRDVLAVLAHAPAVAVPLQAAGDHRSPTTNQPGEDKGDHHATVHRPDASVGDQHATAHRLDESEGELIPLTPTRRAIISRLAASVTIPTFTLSVDVDMSTVLHLRERLPFRPSVTAIIARAVAPLLLKHPDLNSSMREDGIWRYHTVHLGIAVDSQGRLLVPVIRHAQRMDLATLHQTIRELRERIETRRIGPADLQGSTFSISNLGMFGIDMFTAIINPPEAAILAVGRISERPVQRDSATLFRPVCTLTLTVDHRVTDGATAARFLSDLRAALEEPYLLL